MASASLSLVPGARVRSARVSAEVQWSHGPILYCSPLLKAVSYDQRMALILI